MFCASPVCDRPASSGGLCPGHYNRVKKGTFDPLATPLRGWKGSKSALYTYPHPIGPEKPTYPQIGKALASLDRGLGDYCRRFEKVRSLVGDRGTVRAYLPSNVSPSGVTSAVVECGECGHVWTPRVEHLKAGKWCSGPCMKATRDEAEVIAEVATLQPDLTVVEYLRGVRGESGFFSHPRVTVEGPCGCRWSPKMESLRNRLGGCPEHGASGGFKAHEPAFFYVITVEAWGVTGFGITGDIDRRAEAHRRAADAVLVAAFGPHDGATLRNFETALKSEARPYRDSARPVGLRTEAFPSVIASPDDLIERALAAGLEPVT